MQVQPKPAPAAPAKAEGAAAPASVGSAPAKAPAKPAAGAPGPAKPPVKPAGAPPVDISSFPVSASNALEMAKIYMNMEEMDIAKQFLTQAAENGSPEQKEEAKQLLEWWK